MADKKRPVSKRNGKAERSSKKTASASRPAKPGKPTSDSAKVSSQPRKKADGRRRAKRALRMNEAAYQHIVDAMEDSLTVLEADGTILFSNSKAAHNLSGRAASAVIGENISQFVPKEQTENLLEKYRRVIATGQPLEQEVMVTLQGIDRWFMNTLKPVSFGVHNIPALVSHSRDNTEFKRAEDKLRESEDKFRSIFEKATDGIMIADAETKRQIEANKAICGMLGYARDEIVGLSIDDIHPKKDLPSIRGLFEKQLRGEISLAPEVPMLRKDGSVVYADINATSVTLGGKQCLVGIFRDITENKKTQDALAASEEKYKFLVETTNTGYVIINSEGLVIDANAEYVRMSGHDRLDEILGRSVVEWTAAYDQARNAEEIKKCFASGFVRDLEIDYVGKNGRTTTVEINANIISSGDAVRIFTLCRDITERKRIEAVLKTREKQLAESQRIAHIGSWEHNLGTGGVFWSDEMFRLLGLDPKKDPADFNMFFEMIHPDDRPALKKAIDVTLQQHIPYSINYRFVLRDGTIRIIHAQAELIPDASGYLVILSGTAQDITDRKEAEDRIRQNEKFIRSILDTVDEGFIVIDKDYRIMTANKAYCSQVSLPCDNVIGRHCYEISHKTARPCFEEGEECAVRQVIATGEHHTVVHKHTDHDGHILFVEAKGYPIKDQAGLVTSVIETINNITEKHLLEEERLKTQKLESIGTLAGGIAHDFNNLLQGIFGYISMAKMTFDQKEKSLSMLEQAEKALHQSVNLTTQLLTFSKGGKPVKKLISLRPVIENSARFSLSGSRSDFRLNIPEDLWQTEADEGQLGQVIQNIVLNADQAMPVGGTVIVTAVNMVGSDASLPPGLAKGDYVVIAVQDTGVGIPEQYLSRIFDPYFTTKEKGSGLGLATAYSIVRNHGGMIDVRTKSGEGCAFTIYLPAIAGEGRIESAVRPQELSRPRRAKILLMDDEKILRNLSSELLGALGHDVEVAKHGQEALEKYQGAIAAGSPFDIVILDLTVRGGMGGAETVQKLLGIDPAVKAIVSSGYSGDAATANHLKHGFKAYLKKPYNIDELRDIVNSLLS